MANARMPVVEANQQIVNSSPPSEETYLERKMDSKDIPAMPIFLHLQMVSMARKMFGYHQKYRVGNEDDFKSGFFSELLSFFSDLDL